MWLEAIYNPSGRPYKITKFARDISDQKRRLAAKEHAISHAASHDALTQVGDDELNVLLRRADIALYAVKNHAKNGFQLFDAAYCHDRCRRYRLPETDTISITLNGYEGISLRKIRSGFSHILSFDACLKRETGFNVV